MLTIALNGRRRLLLALALTIVAVLAALAPVGASSAQASSNRSKTYSTAKVCTTRDGGKVRICTWFTYWIVKIDWNGRNHIYQQAHAEMFGSVNKKLQAQLRYRNPRTMAHSRVFIETPSTGGVGTLHRHTGTLSCDEFSDLRVGAPYSYFAPKPTNAWIHGTIYGHYYRFQGMHHGTCPPSFDFEHGP